MKDIKSKEDEILRIINDGFQMDYDREDNLVEVFKKADVLEDILFYLLGQLKQEAIEFADFLKDNSYTKGKDGWYKYFTQRTDYPAGFSMSMPVYNFLTLENIYDVFLQSKQK